MQSRLNERIVRLERGQGGWKAWEGAPVEQWPDAALLAFLGLPADASDADLQRIIDEAPKAERRP